MTTPPQGAVDQQPSKSRFERVVETLATGLGETVAWLAERGVLFVLFAAMWLGLGVLLVVNSGQVGELWRAVGDLPFLVQLLAWVLFLPVMAGLWVWETTWPDFVRIAIVLALAAWTLLIFRPKWLHLPTTKVGGTTGA